LFGLGKDRPVKKIAIKQERREVGEAELQDWLDVPLGYRLTGARLGEQKRGTGVERTVELIFDKYEAHSIISVATARQERLERQAAAPADEHV